MSNRERVIALLDSVPDYKLGYVLAYVQGLAVPDETPSTDTPAATEKGFTTSVTDLGDCLIIVRNVPCYKCKECSEIIYSADVVQRLEKIIETAKKLMQEVSIIDYSQAA